MHKPDAESAVSDRDKRLTLIALLIVFLLAALDMTILSTAMPRIVAELNGLELYAWVSTAYMLASTVLVPIYGKLGDMYGRKPILLIGVGIFLGGSVLCGISGEFGTLPVLGDGMHQLIIFRAVKGVGGAALFTSAIGIVADLYPPMQRARFMGMFGAIFGLASIIGPAIGGFLTDFATVQLFGHEIAGWRWVFYVNIPLGLLAVFMIAYRMPSLNRGSGGRIDWAGALLILLAFIPFLLALTWGGSRYAWDSAELLLMFTVSAAALVLFVFIEARTQDAIMPLGLFKNKVFVITNMSAFVIGMAFLGVVMFMPLFMQVVMGVNATNSGFSMFPLMSGMMLSSLLCGRLVSRHGHYKPYMVSGAAVLILGFVLLQSIGPDTTMMGMAWRMLILGLGLGPSQSLVNLVVQAAFPVSEIGVATSSTQFFRQIGNTVGVAVFGSLLTLNLSAELPRQVPMLSAFSGQASESIDLSQAQGVAMQPEALRSQIRSGLETTVDTLDSAYAGNAQARAALLNNPLLPDSMREALQAVPEAGLPAAERESRIQTLRDTLPAIVEQMASSLREGLRQAFSNAITGMFSTCLWIIVAGFLITLFIPVIQLQGRPEKTT